MSSESPATNLSVSAIRVNPVVLWCAVLMVWACFLLSGSEFIATCLAQSHGPTFWHAARIFDPWDAKHANLEGNYELAAGNIQRGLEMLNKASTLDPNDSTYQLDLATAELSIGHAAESQKYLARAIAVNPKSPQVALYAASFYGTQNRVPEALNELRTVMSSKGELAAAALRNAWEITPDAGFLLENVIPADRDLITSFMEMLIAVNDQPGAALAWGKLFALHQQIESRFALEYTQFLLDRKDVMNARQAWREAAHFAKIENYQPTRKNDIVNGGFEFPPLSGGFDWRYEKSPGVEFSLDTTEFHSGNDSLQLNFDSPGLSRIGVWQLVAVEPATDYQFEAFYKTKKLSTAAAPQFVLSDAYSNQIYFRSSEMGSADKWTSVRGTFHVAATTQLLAMRVEMPTIRAIRGKLWIDDVSITPAGTKAAGKVR